MTPQKTVANTSKGSDHRLTVFFTQLLTGLLDQSVQIPFHELGDQPKSNYERDLDSGQVNPFPFWPDVVDVRAEPRNDFVYETAHPGIHLRLQGSGCIVCRFSQFYD
jgi:hypothetical protein